MNDETIENLIDNAGSGPANIYDRETKEHFAYYMEVRKKHGLKAAEDYAEVLTLGNIRFLLSSDFSPMRLYGNVPKVFIQSLKEAEKILLEKEKSGRELRQQNADRFVRMAVNSA